MVDRGTKGGRDVSLRSKQRCTLQDAVNVQKQILDELRLVRNKRGERSLTPCPEAQQYGRSTGAVSYKMVDGQLQSQSHDD